METRKLLKKNRKLADDEFAEQDHVPSPAVQLVQLVAANEGFGWGRSNDRSDRAVREALDLAIRFGLRFDLGDFQVLTKRPFCVGYGEEFYSAACRTEGKGGFQSYGCNRSACQAFEHYKGRKPFIFEGQRLAVGSSFTWDGADVECTSFAQDGTYLRACSYHPREDGKPCASRKVAKCHRIGPADLQAERRRRRLFCELVEGQRALRETDPARARRFTAWLTERFGIRERDEFSWDELQEVKEKLDQAKG